MSAVTAGKAGADLQDLCRRLGRLLEPPGRNQLYLRVTDDKSLLRLSRELRERGFFFVTLAGTDERDLVDGCFKLTYLFSHPTDDLFLFVERPAGGDAITSDEIATYTSLCADFGGVDPLERELADLMGLFPQINGALGRVRPGTWLHPNCYPPALYPLRRDRTQARIVDAIERHAGSPDGHEVAELPDGEWLLVVGPIHAGIIEPGQFLFRLGGEVIEEVRIRLGYTHKGIERLFQTEYTLEDGWRLAEHVSGDSVFAHSLAYCRAAEALAGVHPPHQAELLRSLFLELERMANHIGDCGALAHDVALGVAASELTALREEILRLNETVTGHRLLRGLNRPGGVRLPHPLDREQVRQTVAAVSAQFAELAEELGRMPAFRDRLQWTGILTRRQALDLGATGLVVRASGVRRDFRVLHPAGAYRDEAVHAIVRQGLPPPGETIQAREAAAGDALARFLVRVREVGSSARLVEHLLSESKLTTSSQTDCTVPASFRPERNFSFGLGWAEGWRGDVVYWLMQDKFGRIFRCKVRDPSVLNWPALKTAIEPHELDDDYVEMHRPLTQRAETILPDFPVVNKSFNLSYSGNDL